MSILIKTEMPKNCTVCDVERQANCIVWQGAEPSKTGRHENCPLVELPPHGRLIDGDKLAAGCDAPHYCRWLSEIEDAPTIIEAEGTE